MLFNSLDFAVFLPVVFGIYWLLQNKALRVQNAFLVLASYFFYGCWNWRFLALIVFSTAVDYFVGLKLVNSERERNRKILLWTSIGVNLGVLGFFKYYNFFLTSFTEVFSFLGIHFPVGSLQIVLPVGISFYTFQTLSYTIDVYRKKIEPVKDLIAFAGFVSFFPQLVAGPIERASHLLPQFRTKRIFCYEKTSDGMRQILWGLFAKVVIADSCAYYTEAIFETPSLYSGGTLVLGAVLFSFQIYGDFSGYSNIAIGTARLFGFDLQQNFAFPFFSRNIAEFWRRWHISLMTWFRDYLYIPLGGSRGTRLKTVRNVFIVFVVSGFWHGARWNFIFWGILHAFFFIPLLLRRQNRTFLAPIDSNQWIPKGKEFLQMLLTFTIVSFAFIFFRSEGIAKAFEYISLIFLPSASSKPIYFAIWIWVLILFMLIVEWISRDRHHALDWNATKPILLIRWTIYIVLSFVVMFFMGRPNPFIYFQF